MADICSHVVCMNVLNETRKIARQLSEEGRLKQVGPLDHCATEVPPLLCAPLDY